MLNLLDPKCIIVYFKYEGSFTYYVINILTILPTPPPSSTVIKVRPPSSSLSRPPSLRPYKALYVGRQAWSPLLIMSRTQQIFKHFLETTFLYVSCYPDNYGPKIFSGFPRMKIQTHPDRGGIVLKICHFGTKWGWVSADVLSRWPLGRFVDYLY